MICASLYRAVFIKNLLRYLAEKILLLNTTNFRGDYPIFLLFDHPNNLGLGKTTLSHLFAPSKVEQTLH
jgi:hypothetical protein